MSGASTARRRAFVSVVLGVLAILAFLPLYLVAVTAFKTQDEYAANVFAPPSGLPFDNLAQAWQAASIGDFMRNSAVVSVATVVLCIAASVALAFALVFLEWRGKRLVYGLCLVLLAVPPLLLLVPVYDLLAHLRLVNSIPGVVLLYATLNVPFTTWLLVAYMRSLPPMVMEAAVLDGANVPRLLLRMVVPLSVPAIATAAALAFIFAWNEFIYAFVLLRDTGTRTLPAGLAGLQGRFYTNFPVLLAGVLISVLPVIAMYVFLQRYLVRGIAVGVD
jgi:ABC-type glycerol-3-phosphate transport system permease component